MQEKKPTQMSRFQFSYMNSKLKWKKKKNLSCHAAVLFMTAFEYFIDELERRIAKKKNDMKREEKWVRLKGLWR